MNTFTSYPFFIQGALVVIFLLFIALAITYIYILAVRWKGSVDTSLRNKYQSKFREILINDIVANESFKIEDLEGIVQELKALHLGKKRIKWILKEDIQHFREQFSGEVNETLRKLYIGLDFPADARAGLQSGNSNVVILSIKELMVMDIQDDQFNTEKFLNHKNQYLRQIARRYIISMEEGGIIKVFDNLTHPISGIEQLELFQVITGLGMQEMPDFSRWTHVDKPNSLVYLCLKLAVHFQQFNSTSIIEQLLVTEDQLLKNEAINALGKLLQTESELTLVNMYDEEDEEIKIEIIKALGRIASGSRLNFLKYIFDNETTVLLKKHAALSIVNHDSVGSLFLTNMYKKASPENQVVLNHVLNSNIKY